MTSRTYYVHVEGWTLDKYRKVNETFEATDDEAKYALLSGIIGTTPLAGVTPPVVAPEPTIGAGQLFSTTRNGKTISITIEDLVAYISGQVAPSGATIALSSTVFASGVSAGAILAAITAPTGWTIAAETTFGGRVAVDGRNLVAAQTLTADATGTVRLKATSASGTESVTKTFDVSVTGTVAPPADTTAPTLVSSSSSTVLENATYSSTLTFSEPVTVSKRTGEETASFTITQTGAPSTTATLSLPAQNYEDPKDSATSGTNTYVALLRAADAAGNLLDFSQTVTVQNVAEITLGATTLSNSAATIGTAFTATVNGRTSGSALALSGAGSAGLTINSSTGAVSGTPTTAGAVNIIETITDATNSPRTSSNVATVSAVAPVLNSLTLSSSTVTAGAAAGTLVGNIQGKTAGSTLVFYPNDGRFVIAGDETNGFKVVTGMTATSAGTVNASLVETLSGATGSPKTSALSIVVNAAAAKVVRGMANGTHISIQGANSSAAWGAVYTRRRQSKTPFTRAAFDIPTFYFTGNSTQATPLVETDWPHALLFRCFIGKLASDGSVTWYEAPWASGAASGRYDGPGNNPSGLVSSGFATGWTEIGKDEPFLEMMVVQNQLGASSPTGTLPVMWNTSSYITRPGDAGVSNQSGGSQVGADFIAMTSDQLNTAVTGRSFGDGQGGLSDGFWSSCIRIDYPASDQAIGIIGMSIPDGVGEGVKGSGSRAKLTALTASGSTLTITTTAAELAMFTDGGPVRIKGATPAAYNVVDAVLTKTSATTATIAAPAAPGSSPATGANIYMTGVGAPYGDALGDRFGNRGYLERAIFNTLKRNVCFQGSKGSDGFKNIYTWKTDGTNFNRRLEHLVSANPTHILIDMVHNDVVISDADWGTAFTWLVGKIKARLPSVKIIPVLGIPDASAKAPISSLTYSGTTATATVDATFLSTLTDGQKVTIGWVNPGVYNVTDAVITKTSSTTFTYTLPSVPSANGANTNTGSGRMQVDGQYLNAAMQTPDATGKLYGDTASTAFGGSGTSRSSKNQMIRSADARLPAFDAYVDFGFVLEEGYDGTQASETGKFKTDATIPYMLTWDGVHLNSQGYAKSGGGFLNALRVPANGAVSTLLTVAA